MTRLWTVLRNRILLANLFVLAVSAGIVLLLTRFVFVRQIDDALRPNLVNLSQSLGDPALIYSVEQLTLQQFRNTVIYAVGISSLVTVVISVIVSAWLWRTMIQPLRQMEQSSRRIAAGNYRERIPPPDSQELAAVVKAFNRMATSLEETDQRRVQLINNVTHELRTPLTSLRGYLEALADGYFTLDAETIAEMEQEIGRLSRLVDSVHDLSAIESAEKTLTTTKLDLIPLIDRAVSQQRPLANAKRLLIDHAELPTSLLAVGNEDAIVQILVNLLTNAVRYSHEGGTISIHAYVKDGTVDIEVGDVGIGISAETIPQIFERFYRTDSARDQHSGGSGIGLTIARELAWRMGGDLTAHSDGLGHGSDFVLSLAPA